jgi:putative phosphoesterase
MLIGVISDTHGLLRPEAMEFLKTCEHIIHAGDVGGVDTLARVRAIAPSSVVRGNVDNDDWARELPETAAVEFLEKSIYVLHNIGHLDLDPASAGFDIVVYGHSHRPVIKRDGGVTFLNPGSIGPRRFGRPVSYAWIDITGFGVSMDIKELK